MTNSAAQVLDAMLEDARKMNAYYGQLLVPQAWLFDNLHVLHRLITERGQTP